MIQTDKVSLLESGERSQVRRTGSLPLKSRAETIENELSSLEQRVNALESTVGTAVPGEMPIAVAPAPPPPPAAEEAVPAAPEEAPPPEEAVLTQSRKRHGEGYLLKKAAKAAHNKAATVDTSKSVEDDSWLYAEGGGREDLALLEGAKRGSRRKAGSLKDRVAYAEKRATTLRSKIIGLENAITGGNAPVGSEQVSGADLKHRMMSLEDECDDLRTRATSLEHVVMGSAS
jgi:type IV secretory pathway VirB10-like protein